MKVGVLTFTNAPNFGAFIQCLGSTTELRRRGLDVHNYDPNPKEHYTRGTIKPQAIFYRIQSYNYARSRQNFNIEVSNYPASQLDGLFVGSDQVLNHNCIWSKSLDPVFGFGSPNVKKFGLSMSALKPENLSFNENAIVSGLRAFSKLSFREEWLRDWANKKSLSSDRLPDPSLLLTRSDILDIASKSNDFERYSCDTLFVGYNIKQWARYIDHPSVRHGTVKYINFQYRDLLSYGLFPFGIERAMSRISSASSVVTNSFHFALLSIIMGKRVVMPFGNSWDGGARLHNLALDFNFHKLSETSLFLDPCREVDDLMTAYRSRIQDYISKCIDCIKS